MQEGFECWLLPGSCDPIAGLHLRLFALLVELGIRLAPNSFSYSFPVLIKPDSDADLEVPSLSALGARHSNSSFFTKPPIMPKYNANWASRSQIWLPCMC